jgi:hypothetical protein
LNHTCTFFNAKSPSLGRSALTKPSSRSSVKPKPRPRSTRVKQTVTETEQSSDDDANTLWMSTRTTRSNKLRSAKLSTPMSSQRATDASTGKAAAAGSEGEDQSGSEAQKISKNKPRRTKSKAKIAAIAEEEEDIQAPDEQPEEEQLRKSQRKKGKVKKVFEDIEVELAPEEPRKHPLQTRRQTRSKSRAKFESDSDAVAHTKSTNKLAGSDSEAESSRTSRRRTAVKPSSSKSKHLPSRTTTKREKLAPSAQYSESSDTFDIPKTSKPKSKEKPGVVESESQDTEQSALEEAGLEKLTKANKKYGRRLESTTKASGKMLKPSRDEATLPSEPELLKPSSLIREEEQLREQSSKPAKKPSSKMAPFHDKSSNQRLRAELDLRVGSHASPRTSVGSKENVTAPSEEREGELQSHRIIDISDDAEDSMTKKPVSSRPTHATASSTAAGLETKSSRRVKKKLEVVIETRTPKRTSHTKEIFHGSDVAMEVDVDTEKHPIASARPKDKDHDVRSGNKSYTKQTVAAGLPLQERPVLKQHATDLDIAMDVDEQEPFQHTEVHAPPSTPPRTALAEDSNPFSLPARDDQNPLLAFQAPFGKLPMETMFTLTEAEKDMTIEEWTKRELETQLENFRRDGYRQIQAFKDRAAEVRRQIETL